MQASGGNPVKQRKDGGTRCAALGCDNSKLKANVGVFEFPDRGKSPDRFQFWCRTVRRTRQDFVFKKGTSRLCADHFDRDQIQNWMYLRIMNEQDPDSAKKIKWRLIPKAKPNPSLMPKRPGHGTPKPSVDVGACSQSQDNPRRSPSSRRAWAAKKDRRKIENLATENKNKVCETTGTSTNCRIQQDKVEIPEQSTSILEQNNHEQEILNHPFNPQIKTEFPSECQQSIYTSFDADPIDSIKAEVEADQKLHSPWLGNTLELSPCETQHTVTERSSSPFSSSVNSIPNSSTTERMDTEISKKIIVDISCIIDELFKRCQLCGESITLTKTSFIGARALISWSCDDGHTGTWNSLKIKEESQ